MLTLRYSGRIKGCVLHCILLTLLSANAEDPPGDLFHAGSGKPGTKEQMQKVLHFGMDNAGFQKAVMQVGWRLYRGSGGRSAVYDTMPCDKGFETIVRDNAVYAMACGDSACSWKLLMEWRYFDGDYKLYRHCFAKGNPDSLYRWCHMRLNKLPLPDSAQFCRDPIDTVRYRNRRVIKKNH